MRKILQAWVLVVGLCVASIGAEPVRTEAGAITAEPYPRHFRRHADFLAKISELHGDFDLLLIGDSITDHWPRIGASSYAMLTQWKPLNLGISGESTGLVLWRLQNGELDGIHPKVTMIMIGTNNLGHFGQEKPEWVAAGVRKIIELVRAKIPNTKILLLSIFPRSEKVTDPIRKRVDATNALLAQLGDGKNVTYLDIGKKFLDAGGVLSKDIMPDFLHPNEKGYQIWLDSVKPVIENLMR